MAATVLVACQRPVSLHSEIAEQVADRLCSIQDTCGCDEDLLIPDCHDEVEHEITRNERRAIEAGLVLDDACLETFFAALDALATCEPTIEPRVDCRVYHGDAQVGEPCRVYEFYPPMTDCQPGLECREGACRDLDNPQILQEGEICSDTQGWVPTGYVGECAEGLVCDSPQTRTCIPYEPPPQVPLGSQCSATYECEEGYCRPPDGLPDASEENPGICTLPTAAGQPCTLPYECERFCEDGFCQHAPPLLCEIVGDWDATRSFLEQGG